MTGSLVTLQRIYYCSRLSDFCFSALPSGNPYTLAYCNYHLNFEEEDGRQNIFEMEMEIGNPTEKFVDTGHYITERYCTESTCKFGCKHDGHYIRCLSEKEHNCRFGNVQTQRYGKRYDCISHDNCPVRLRIYFKKHKIYSTITPIQHSDNYLLAERGIQHMWRVEVDRCIEVDMNPSQIYENMQQLASSSMQQYAHLIPSLHQIINRKKRFKSNNIPQDTFTYNDDTGYVSLIIDNRIGFIPSSIKLQEMNDSAFIPVHFFKPDAPGESEVNSISLSEIRKGIQDLEEWTQEMFAKPQLISEERNNSAF
jgi:hypothetical protein